MNSCNQDFVIRDGFPALQRASGEPLIEGDEAIPRHSFWAHETALSFKSLPQLHADCETVFSVRTKEEDHQAYSTGITYFLPCQMKPRCALEELVQDIFKKHTSALELRSFRPEQSGSEWWTLVLDNDDDESKEKSHNGTEEGEGEGEGEDEEEVGDEVGMHFDADYGLEDQAPDLLLHPRIASVTYLSDTGAPTVILDKRSPPPDDTEKIKLSGGVDKAWISHPKVGKHICFDGRLLHGAPATFFPAKDQKPASATNDTDDAPPAKRQKTVQAELAPKNKRYTLLVNIWLNHCPLDAEPLEEDVVEKLLSPWSKADGSAEAAFTWSENFEPSTRESESCSKVALKVSNQDPAGEEEVAICSRIVTIKYSATMEELHAASRISSLVELDLGKDVLTIEVGEKIHEDENEDET